MGGSRTVFRQRLLAGASVVSLALHAVPAMATCLAVGTDTTITTNASCATWTGGNLSVTNTGTLSATLSGVSITGSNPGGTLTNSGTIEGSTFFGVGNSGTIGALINGGSISGGFSGISSSGSIGTLTNSGTIKGSTFSGVGNSGTIGALINSGSIGGGLGGINNRGSIGTLTNSGTIGGTGANGTGIYNSRSIGTLTNSGSIRDGRYGVNTSGSIANLTNGGTISGGFSGISTSGSIGTLTNSGTIEGSTFYGVENSGGIGTLTNGGTISGGFSGIANIGSIGTLTNSGTISGSAGIYNSRSIGTLTNSGAVSGGRYGIKTSGSIANLTNSGTISGGNTGVANLGSIGAVTNSGTIKGPLAIDNTSTGTLGPIVNSGLIAGNIINAAARDLTINGGSGTGFGTLTGSSGSIGSANEGTITNTSANVVFSSGNLLLNDAINVASHSVSISGATIAVANPVAITGAWQQTGGGLVAQAASASSYGYLAVNGNATVANAAIVIQGSGLASGNSFTIVRSGAAGSYAGDSASVIGTSGLAATVATVGNDLVVTLNVGDTFTPKGLAAGGVAAPLGAVLDAINGSSSPVAIAFQNSVLMPLSQLPSGQQGPAIKQLAPVQSGFQIVDDGAATVLGAVEQHQQTSMAFNPSTGKAAGSDTLDSTLWAQMLGGGAERDTSDEAGGYRSSDYGLTAGADHLFTPDLLGGVALSWLRAWTRGTASASGQSSTMNSYQLTFYGTYRMGRAFLDGQLGAGWNHFDQNRTISFLNQTASAGYDGQQYLASALAGYDIGVGGPGNMTLTPLAGLRWLHAHTDSYTETGAGAADLSVNGQSADAVTQELGFRTAWSFQTGIGTIQPEFKAEWLHDYTNGTIATSGVIGGQAFVVSTPRVSANGARIGVAATLATSDSLSFRAEYDGELRAGYQSHTGLIKALWQF